MTSTAPWVLSPPTSKSAATGTVEDAGAPLHIDDVSLSLVPDPVYLCAPKTGIDETGISRWVLSIRPLYRLSSSERHTAEKAIDEAGRLLARMVEAGTIGDIPARWLLFAMINQADIAQSAAHSWLINNRRGHGTGDAEELTDMVRDEFHKTVVGEDGDPDRAAWQWDRVASTCGWARKIAMRAAQQRKDKLGERNRVRLYGSSETDRRTVFGAEPPAPAPMPPEDVDRGDFRDNPAGALGIRQHLEFQQVAARLVAKLVGVPDVPRVPGHFRVQVAEALAGSKASEVHRALRAVNDGGPRPQQTEQALLFDLWAAATPQAREALLSVQDPRMCVAWAQGQVAPRPRYSLGIINRVAVEFKPLRPMRKWTAMCNALAEAYAESVAELPNELTRIAFRSAVEKTDSQLLADRRSLLALAQAAIDMWVGGTCPMGHTPEQVEATLRDCFNDIIDDLADERSRNIS